MNVHISGALCSPSVCTYVLRRTAEDCKTQFPAVLDKVLNNFYVDNYLDSFMSEREAEISLPRENCELRDTLAQQHIQWNFSPPFAPHFGGIWERLVRSVKSALCRILSGRAVNDEVLATALVEVESLLNSGPLTHVSIDPRDPEPLTPNHFLLGRPHPHLPPDVIAEAEITSRRKWRCAQAIVEAFWKSLFERRKWLRPRRNLEAGDIVLVVNPQSPRGHWPHGIVVQCLPGKDGTVRIAKVKTKHGIYIRPVTKLCIFEMHETDVSEKTFTNMVRLCKGKNGQNMSGPDGECSQGRDTSRGSDRVPADPLTRSGADQTVIFVSATGDRENSRSC
ncbi:hypothetical protein M514_19297 [Trichuris suis]|uniref:DUF5641 domain-containing protein n=1 Tax=Trichuris suis TaxID=68888 RepID=A0A085NG75_9BILA|nr:hypothetical protein M514_19297 [Trichuris suis]